MNTGKNAKEHVSDRLRSLWWAFLLRGVIAIGLGFCALFWPQQTVNLLTKILGAYFLFDAVLAGIGWMRSKETGHYLLPIIISLTSGLVLIFWSGVSAKMFMVIMGIWTVLQGLGLLASWWQMDRGDANRGLVAAVAALFVIAGVVLVAWPETGVVAISWTIATCAFLIGAALIFLAMQLRQFKRVVDQVGEA